MTVRTISHKTPAIVEKQAETVYQKLAVNMGKPSLTLHVWGPNQTQVTTKTGLVIFFSYSTPVAGTDKDGYFRTGTKYSPTTTRHINNFLDGNPARTVTQDWIEDLLT